MIRCCVIGNSYVAALKTGWDPLAAGHPQVRVTWFASRGMSQRELQLRDRALHPQSEPVRQSLIHTSDGLDHIALDDYDAFVLCGMGLSVLQVLAVYATHCTMEHNAWTDSALVSTPCFEQAVATLMRDGLLIRVARMVREVSSAPIVAVSTPMPVSGVLRDKAARSRVWQRAVRHRDELALAETYDRVAAANCAPCGAVVPPPAGDAEVAADQPHALYLWRREAAARLRAHARRGRVRALQLRVRPPAVGPGARARRDPCSPADVAAQAPHAEPGAPAGASGPESGFVLYALPHSGSQELVAWLNGAADVLCHGEVFKSGTTEADHSVLERLGMRRSDVERRDHDRVTFLQRLRSRSPRRVFGLRFSADHVRRDLDLQRRVLEAPACRKVFFVPSSVKVYAAALRARASDTPGSAEAPLYFSEEGFDATLQAQARLEQVYQRQAAEQPGDVFRLTHEDLAHPVRLAELLSFLGSHDATSAIGRAPVPVVSIVPHEAFDNWPQFEAHLRQGRPSTDAVTH